MPSSATTMLVTDASGRYFYVRIEGEKTMEPTRRTGGFMRVIGLAVVVVVLICNPITLGVLAGIVQTSNFQGEGRDAVREQVFMTSCQEYKEASTWERWTTADHWKFGWCADYIERM
jgi:hypothetical protein